MLPKSFYTRDDVVAIGRELLGKMLCTRINGGLAKAIITETEAYAGIDDRASHAFGGRRTARNEPMYSEGGVAYVYLCYGIHHLFNVVTGEKDMPHAVLIRASDSSGRREADAAPSRQNQSRQDTDGRSRLRVAGTRHYHAPERRELAE